MAAINLTEKEFDLIMNGSTVFSRTQRDNSASYDITDETSRDVDILVNGSQRASFNQTSDSNDYDIPISPNVSGSTSVTYKLDASFSRDPDGSSFSLRVPIPPNEVLASNNVSYRVDDSSGRFKVELKVNGNTVDSGFGFISGSVTVSGGDTVVARMPDIDSSMFCDAEVTVDYINSINTSVGNVTQS